VDFKSLDIQDLAPKIKRSDNEAFKELFEKSHQSLFNFIRYKIGDGEAAEDLTQEVFVKIWEGRHGIKEQLSFKSYLYTIANNLALNYLRDHKVVIRFVLDPEHEPHHHDSPDAILEKKEFRETLLSIISELPEQPRTVFMMSRFDDLSYQEIAERLSLSVKTVESHMGKALKIIRKRISLYDDDEKK